MEAEVKLLTWEYIVDAMNQRYGVSVLNDEGFSLFEIEALIEGIYKDC